MGNDNVNIFYDGNGKPIAVQLPIEDYEKIINSAKEAVESKDAITKAIEVLQSAL